jgi:hypothetical protein
LHTRNPRRARLYGLLVVALTIEDRQRILRALERGFPDGLAELRGVLLREHEGRVREGL